jgi:hypothetical protein
MRLVFESGMRGFPPRLAGQPIFYPVLNGGYAAQIARDWNARQDTFAGYVLRFEVPDSYAAQFNVRTVGNSTHRELWIPAEELVELNSRLVGNIDAERAFFGGAFRGDTPDGGALGGKDAYEQIAAMAAMLARAPADFVMEIAANATTIFLNYPFWKAAGAHRFEMEATTLANCLERVRVTWSRSPGLAALIEDVRMVG